METKKYTIYCQTTSVEATQQMGNQIGEWLRSENQSMCIALIGDLGTGKTHMSKGIGKGFGVTSEMTSPTFSLMNTYDVEGSRLYHFDLYRIESVDELENIAFCEYTEDQISIVEWANLFETEIPEETIWITIESIDEGTRRIQLSSDVVNEEVLQKLGGQYVVGY